MKNKVNFEASEINPGSGVFTYQLDLGKLSTPCLMKLTEELASYVDRFYGGRLTLQSNAIY